MIVPGAAPLGSSATVRWPQANSVLWAHGVNAIAAPAGAAAAQLQMAVVRSTEAVFPTERRTDRNLAASHARRNDSGPPPNRARVFPLGSPSG